MKYNRPFTWLQRTGSKNHNTGQREPEFAANGVLWGNLKELSASKQLAYGMQNSQATYEVRLKQLPDLDPKDRLRDRQFGLLLVIDGLMKVMGTNETVVYCHSIQGVIEESSSSAASEMG
jgi:hypothetical protein